jgi:hypothetical protein
LDRPFTATGSSTVLQFGERDDPDWIALDDVSVNAVATPEPARVIALGIGIVGMGGYALRRRRTAALATC